jgi:hypothetical protein
MFTLQELGSYLHKLKLNNSMSQFPHFVRPEIFNCIYGIVVVPSHLYKIIETLSWRFSWCLRYFYEMGKCTIRWFDFSQALAESKSDVFISINRVRHARFHKFRTSNYKNYETIDTSKHNPRLTNLWTRPYSYTQYL